MNPLSIRLGLWLCQSWTRFPYLECLMNASIKENVLALTSKTETLLINRQKETNMKNQFAPL